MAMMISVTQSEKACLHPAEGGAWMMSSLMTSPYMRHISYRCVRLSSVAGKLKKSSVPLLHCTLPSWKQAHAEAGAGVSEPLLTSKHANGNSSIPHLSMPSGLELSALQMPVLRCSFPSLLHPQYEAVREQCDDWILAVAQPPSATSRRFLQDCLLPRLLCRCIPHRSASVQRLIHAAKMLSWLLIADDNDDHPDALGSDYDTTARRADTVMAILRLVPDCDNELFGPQPPEPASAYSSFGGKSRAGMEALAQLWNEISKEMSPRLRTRFISSMADYFNGLKVQAAFRKAKCLPNVKDYMEIRRKSSFTLPAFVLVEYMLGVELDEATYNNPLMVELHDTVRDFINLCNDIISCPIEIGLGDYFNLPSILYTSKDASSPCSSFQEALDLSAHMAHNLDARYVSLLADPIHSPLLMGSPSLVLYTYVNALSSCMSGSLAWSLETARYREPSIRSELYQLGCIHDQTSRLN